MVLVPVSTYAQVHQEMGFAAGVANYYGDLQPNLFPGYGYKPMGGLVYKYFMDPHAGLRFGASYTNLTAADSLSNIPANKARNLSFATHLIEMNGALEVNLLPIDKSKRHATPYIFGGISVFYFNPYAIDPQGDKVYLKPLSTEGEGLAMYPDSKPYSLVNVAFPIGGGFKWLIGNKIMLAAEVGFRYTNTDYLDDVSKTYVNLDTLQKYRGTIARQMSFRGNTAAGWNGSYPNYGDQRGNNTSNDWYYFINITATVYFHSFHKTTDYIKTLCPVLFR